MPLPRKQLAKNTSTHKKYGITREATRKIIELDNVCTKHKVGKLTFKKCKFATEDGTITFIEHDEIKGNMKSGIMIIKANEISESKNFVYDLVQIQKDKRESDLKKIEDDAKKAQLEIERLKNSKTETTIPNVQPEHENLLMKLVKESETKEEQKETKEEINKKINEETKEEIKEEQKEEIKEEPEESSDEEDDDKTVSKKSNKTHRNTESKRKKALQQMKEQLEKKSNPKPERNKFYRNFMKDLKGKFSLEKQDKFKFLEVRAETTDMVIVNAEIYKIGMPVNTKVSYFIVIGDLQLKTGLIKQIDPNYNMASVLKEQNDFLERIKAKENAKIKEVEEEILDEEFNDFDELGISDEEDNTKDNSPKDNDPVKDAMINELMNPELVEMNKN